VINSTQGITRQGYSKSPERRTQKITHEKRVCLSRSYQVRWEKKGGRTKERKRNLEGKKKSDGNTETAHQYRAGRRTQGSQKGKLPSKTRVSVKRPWELFTGRGEIIKRLCNV